MPSVNTFSGKKPVSSLGNLHKRATHNPADSADYIVPAKVLEVRMLQDDVPSVLAVRSKPVGIDDHIAEQAAVAAPPVEVVVHTGREPPVAVPVSLRKPLDIGDKDREPMLLRKPFAAEPSFAVAAALVAVAAAAAFVVAFAELVLRSAVPPG